MEVLCIQLFVNRWRIWIKTYTDTLIVARWSDNDSRVMVSKVKVSQRWPRNLVDSEIPELLKGFEQKTYPNACSSRETKWLRFQGDGLRGQGHKNVRGWGIQIGPFGSLSHRHLVTITSHKYPCYLCRICHLMCMPVGQRKLSSLRSCSSVTSVQGTLRPTALPWLPVLANIEPSALRRKAATDRLVAKARAHESWLLHHDISNPPLLRLTSRKPLWHESEPADINSQWRESLKWASVVNAHLVDDSTIR